MLSLAEIGPALYGAWRLAHFDPKGMGYFDRSLEGFWRSFRVSILVAPLWAAIVAMDVSEMKTTGGWFNILAGESIAYVIGWAAFPLLAFYLTEFVDRRSQYLGFIVAYNWSSVIQLALFFPVRLILHSGILPNGLVLLIIYAVQIGLLVYEWFIVRTALNLPGLGAAGIVAIDVFISYLTNHFGDAIAQGG